MSETPWPISVGCPEPHMGENAIDCVIEEIQETDNSLNRLASAEASYNMND